MRNPFVVGLLLVTLGVLIGYALASRQPGESVEGICPYCGGPLGGQPCAHLHCREHHVDPPLPEVCVPPLGEHGIVIRGHSFAGVAEEAPGAYKPVDQVVNVMHESGLARKVVRVRPLISIKG